MNEKLTVPFSPPDIDEDDIAGVVEVLRSGWITTGPKVKLFESRLAEYCQTKRGVCLSSATAGLELALRIFGIGKGDEVITTPYTFAATANVILHTGAKPVFVDVSDNCNIDPEKIGQAITSRTKAILSVDFAGMPCDYDLIKGIIKDNRPKFKPSKNIYQKKIGQILFISDAAHSLGGFYKSNRIGQQADISVFSFHAVKNLTTAEGGGCVFNDIEDITADEIYREYMLYSLHGQSKDAMAKYKSGSWKYDILTDGYKYNMTDIMGSLGLTQLSRYDEIINRRRDVCGVYNSLLGNDLRFTKPIFKNATIESSFMESSYHLYPLRINDKDGIPIAEKDRDRLISVLASEGISTNVHFIPLPLLSVYRKLGYKMDDFKNAYLLYSNELSLPLFSRISNQQIERVIEVLKKTTS